MVRQKKSLGRAEFECAECGGTRWFRLTESWTTRRHLLIPGPRGEVSRKRTCETCGSRYSMGPSQVREQVDGP